MYEKKGVLLILDGLGDRPVVDLGEQTPLEAARTPVMDRLVAAGLSGMVYHIAPGIPVGTQTGCGLLLGLAPSDIGKLSRGLVQAVGAGVDVQSGDVAIRCNFATLDWQDGRAQIIDRRAGRISLETGRLIEALNDQTDIDGVKFIVSPSTQHRASLVLRGAGLSDAISNTDPGSGKKENGLLVSRALHPGDTAAERTALLLNTYLKKSYALLKGHPINKARQEKGLLPANALITRGAGRAGVMRNILELHQIKTAVISGEGTLHGLGRLFNFDVIIRPEFTATTDTDLHAKVASAIEALEDHDLVVLHIKGPDICGHDRDPAGKKAFIETIDAALQPLEALPIVIGVTADHSTDSTEGRHTGDPVPSFITSSRGRKDDVQVFSEAGCGRGRLGNISATAFLCTMLDLMDRMPNFRSHELEYYR